MKNIKISKKDIRQNQKYKEELEILERRKIDYIFLLGDAVEYGSYLERNNNTRNYQERWDIRNEYINKIANIYNEHQDELFGTLLQLLTENIAMKKALKQAKINVHLTD